ncbi:hypothetical protein VPH35_133149 [Triticum aestivum]
MDDGDKLDDYARKDSGMAARYAMLGSTLDDNAMVKKLLDTVPDRLYAAVAGIEQFFNVEKMVFEKALGRLKAFEERTSWRVRAGGERADGQLMMTAAQWAARERRQGGRSFGDQDDDGAASTASGNGGKRRGCCYKCGEHWHFRRACPQLQKGPAAEQALLACGVVGLVGARRVCAGRAGYTICSDSSGASDARGTCGMQRKPWQSVRGRACVAWWCELVSRRCVWMTHRVS